MRRRSAALLTILLASTAPVLLLAPGTVHAHAAPPSQSRVDPSELPTGALKRAIMDADKRARAQRGRPELVTRPLSEAIRAGQRARDARAAGDGRHGAMLEKLGMAWVKVADTVLRAADAEAKASTEAKRLYEHKSKLVRAEALLAEQQARLGRLSAEVGALEKAAKEKATQTLHKERARVEPRGGTKQPAPVPGSSPEGSSLAPAPKPNGSAKEPKPKLPPGPAPGPATRAGSRGADPKQKPAPHPDRGGEP